MGVFVAHIAFGGLLVAFVLVGFSLLGTAVQLLVAPTEAFVTAMMQILSISPAIMGPLFPPVAIATIIIALHLGMRIAGDLGLGYEIDFDALEDGADEPESEEVDPIEEIREQYARGELTELEMEAALEDALEESEETELEKEVER